MSEKRALAVAFDNSDKGFFKQNADRIAHIRLPFEGECSGEFWQLGEHNRARRRIILWRVPPGNPYYHPEKMPFLKIPFLAFADEEIADRDDVLLPIVEQIMLEQYGIHSKKPGA